MAASVLLFLLDNILIFWFEWPGLRQFLWGVPEVSRTLGWIQFLLSLAIAGFAVAIVILTSSRKLADDAELYGRASAFVVRTAFWAVLLVGVTDMLISFLRVEGVLDDVVGDALATQLGRSIFRGTWIHFPLIIAAIVIAGFTRTLGFIWLALLIVVAEFLIVVSRFVFSYEQAFMGDIVRFWYAGLFLFASAYTLLHDGHVRVDVLYTNFSERGKAMTNIFGSLLLGLPLCWNIMIQGMAGKGSSINSPLLNFEISQSGFGMYTKYLMAAFLLIFAISMTLQFLSVILSNVSRLRESPPSEQPEKLAL